MIVLHEGERLERNPDGTITLHTKQGEHTYDPGVLCQTGYDPRVPIDRERMADEEANA